ncbi:acyltransferase family protein [Actinokineospora bangkokensis]|uniref:Acyltransferase 3 domain-containing protein n=1 Tax=Actinokineospora bangkokensis TaxID=1193682 RepID=A0A1Q9LLB1_9PSEU|nr:acyltransferase [Actinokineospora bangkokensis]OLR92805.1 hypothetical protein BJP25_19440 [Actinokineospora bangkokensis]
MRDQPATLRGQGEDAPPGAVERQAPPRTRRIDGLDLLRVLACCLVFYTHVSTWYRFKKDPLPLTGVLDSAVVGPLHLNKDFAFLGVSLFFLISGFVIAHVATREGAAEFAVKRALRVFPPLFAAVLLAWVFVLLGWLSVPGGEDVGFGDLVANLFLVNFFAPQLVTLVGVAWTLIIQLGVYAMVLALLAVFRRMPWLAIAVQVTACMVLLSVLSNLRGPVAASLANIGAFGCAIVLGQVIWLVWSRRAPLWAGVLLGALCWLVVNTAEAGGYGQSGDSYLLTMTLAALVVSLVVAAGGRVKRVRAVAFLSERSYSIYLVHQTTAFAVLAGLAAHTWSSVAVAVAVAVTLAVAEVVHRFVERPSARLAARTTR